MKRRKDMNKFNLSLKIACSAVAVI